MVFLTISNLTINPDKCKYGCMSKNSKIHYEKSEEEIILGLLTVDQKLACNGHNKNLKSKSKIECDFKDISIP